MPRPTRLLTAKEWQAVHTALLTINDDPNCWGNRPDLREAAKDAAEKLPPLIGTSFREFYTPDIQADLREASERAAHADLLHDLLEEATGLLHDLVAGDGVTCELCQQTLRAEDGHLTGHTQDCLLRRAELALDLREGGHVCADCADRLRGHA